MFINGSIDRCGDGQLSGWAACVTDPSVRLELEAMCCEQVFARMVADQYRPDLEAAGIGDGCHGYDLALPPDLPLAAVRSIRLRVAGSDTFLLQAGLQPEDDELAPVYQHLSRYGGLWIDRMDWVDRLGLRLRSGEIPLPLAEQIMAFVRDGYVVLPGAIPADRLAALARAVDGLPDAPRPGMMMRVPDAAAGEAAIPADAAWRRTGAALLDLHATSDELRQVAASPAVLAFLQPLFHDRPRLFASAVQHRGAAFAPMQDSVRLHVPDNALAMASVWIPLEASREGDGGPMAMAGSHRARDFVFPSTGKQIGRSAGQLGHYLSWMRQQAVLGGYVRARPMLAPGDVAIFHADLQHGGEEPATPEITARGVLARFMPERLRAPYDGAPAHQIGETGDCSFQARYPA